MSEVPSEGGPHWKTALSVFRLNLIENKYLDLPIPDSAFFCRGRDRAALLRAEKRTGAHDMPRSFFAFLSMLFGTLSTDTTYSPHSECALQIDHIYCQDCQKQTKTFLHFLLNASSTVGKHADLRFSYFKLSISYRLWALNQYRSCWSAVAP